LKNTDRRPRKNKKVKGDSNSEKPNDHNESDEINETIVHFEINNNFEIIVDSSKNDNDKETTLNIDSSKNDNDRETTLNNGWSLDISNLCRNGNKYFIYVAVSKIDDEDMKKSTIKGKGTRTAIYQIELKMGEKENYVFNKDTETIIYHIYGISGLCRFVEVSKNNENIEVSNSKIENECYTLRRFIILNFDGIHSFNCKDNFNLYKKLNYPKCVRNELDLSKTSVCTDFLRSCIYDRYFLVEHYKDNVQLLEGINQILKILCLSLYVINRLILVYFAFFLLVYDLAKMKLETFTKRIENSHHKFTRKYNKNNFSISENKVHLCFTRGLQSVK
jgi:hypothetical protein